MAHYHCTVPVLQCQFGSGSMMAPLQMLPIHRQTSSESKTKEEEDKETRMKQGDMRLKDIHVGFIIQRVSMDTATIGAGVFNQADRILPGTRSSSPCSGQIAHTRLQGPGRLPRGCRCAALLVWTVVVALCCLRTCVHVPASIRAAMVHGL